MSDARTAILITLDPAHEGGYQANPKDRANWTSGIVGVGTLVGTNGGITALDMPGADIKHLTQDQTIAFYLDRYWKPFYSQITSQLVSNKLFDMGVLFGVGTAVKCIQTALGLSARDGIFGVITLEAVNRTDSSLLLADFREQLKARATEVAANNPNDRADLPDWLRRIDS